MLSCHSHNQSTPPPPPWCVVEREQSKLSRLHISSYRTLKTFDPHSEKKDAMSQPPLSHLAHPSSDSNTMPAARSSLANRLVALRYTSRDAACASARLVALKPVGVRKYNPSSDGFRHPMGYTSAFFDTHADIRLQRPHVLFNPRRRRLAVRRDVHMCYRRVVRVFVPHLL